MTDQQDTIASSSDERWVEYTCVNCDPDSDSDYQRPYTIWLPKNEDGPNYCPRCGSYLSMLDGVEWVVRKRTRTREEYRQDAQATS